MKITYLNLIVSFQKVFISLVTIFLTMLMQHQNEKNPKKLERFISIFSVKITFTYITGSKCLHWVI